ncbi:MAG: L-seryl-tRNA(Sec) selenium transferase [Desulfotomaculaceae bacterium]|nr:L-seryl-tRNA(Sec) selenium transferase [Desulfotomaculaceae bacterium]MDD4766638.1 L-seryl-tRNA(Sec) selenium transferase [Desulfotomaculaceae bacterium]
MSENCMEKSLRQLPSVDEVLRDGRVAEMLENHPRIVILGAVRAVLADERKGILSGAAKTRPEIKKEEYLEMVVEKTAAVVKLAVRPNLRRVINATGVILHTNLGRALLSERAREAVNIVASNYSNLELDLKTGRRGSRYAALENLLTSLTGAEDALVVNNNAAAVLLALSTAARGREVIVSRGQLVEIGGSFRIPEVMAQSGAKLVEVGATNKTYPEDYRRAICGETAMLLHVHTSNYRIIGFTRETTIGELVEIGREYNLPVMSDLGSGFLLDLSRFGLPQEPTVQEVLGAGPDIVTFSGDKLLGGPQAGIILGKRYYIEKMKKNPLTRAVRVDKMTVAALEATLREYQDEEKAIGEIPTLQMLTVNQGILEKRAYTLKSFLQNVLDKTIAEFTVEKGISAVGGGAMPTAELLTAVVAVSPRNISAGELQAALRRGDPAVMGRVQEDRLILDLRTISDTELQLLAEAVARALE